MGRHKKSEKAQRVRIQEAELDRILAWRREAKEVRSILKEENELLRQREASRSSAPR